MTEAEMYELVGRKQAALDALNVEYDRLLALLSQVVSGDVSVARVEVDLPGRKWAVTAETMVSKE